MRRVKEVLNAAQCTVNNSIYETFHREFIDLNLLGMKDNLIINTELKTIRSFGGGDILTAVLEQNEEATLFSEQPIETTKLRFIPKLIHIFKLCIEVSLDDSPGIKGTIFYEGKPERVFMHFFIRSNEILPEKWSYLKPHIKIFKRDYVKFTIKTGIIFTRYDQ